MNERIVNAMSTVEELNFVKWVLALLVEQIGGFVVLELSKMTCSSPSLYIRRLESDDYVLGGNQDKVLSHVS